MLITGARNRLNSSPKYYNNLLSSFPKNFAYPFANKIEIDILRSFPPELNIQDDKLNILRNILIAFSLRSSSLGYVQGYNIILARILLITNFNEIESFWLFTTILEDIYSKIN